MFSLHTNSVTFLGVEYPLRELEDADGITLSFAPVSLQDALLNGNSEPINSQAEKIDDEIFFYLEEDEWELSDEQLMKL